MNRLIATIHWNPKQKEAVTEKEGFFHSHLDLFVERTSVFILLTIEFSRFQAA